MNYYFVIGLKGEKVYKHHAFSFYVLEARKLENPYDEKGCIKKIAPYDLVTTSLK